MSSFSAQGLGQEWRSPGGGGRLLIPRTGEGHLVAGRRCPGRRGQGAREPSRGSQALGSAQVLVGRGERPSRSEAFSSPDLSAKCQG